MGGTQVPADVEHLEGDVLSVDTAALTGEPLPRKYPSDQYGKLVLCGCTIVAGEAYAVVRKTGINTEVGESNAEIMKDKAQTKISVFEEKVLFSVKVIILISLVDCLVIFLVQGIGRREFESNTTKLILTCLSILIAAVPVALPLVLQVTMALGAGTMARDFNAVVTSLPALQDISGMVVLCSDKTGTLTTANISIQPEKIYAHDGFTEKDLALYAVLASNRDKKEDPIDRSVVNYYDGLLGEAEGSKLTKEFTKVRLVGFNPIFKRVVAEYTHPSKGKVLIAKGLIAKILNTEDGGRDDAEDQWKVENCESISPKILEMDRDLSVAGYKTLGVAVKIGSANWKFVGILPQLDPPRHDSAITVKNLVNAGIEVKMITGDHLNIGKETARLIGMGTNMHPGSSTRDGTQATKELIRKADGFAQVLPKDKREVVLTLKDHYQLVVGMTGDGVNDAPALSAAQCGVAVDDATDAAKNASAIILTTPGLSAIYYGVVESRRIFRKLKAYVVYRFAATIQIVIVLSLLIYISNCPLKSLYVILLALFNDLTMLPIAYDHQLASKYPEKTDVKQLLLLSLLLGVMESIFSMVFAYGAVLVGDPFDSKYDLPSCDVKIQAAVWLQMSLAAEFLIFSTRAPTYLWFSIPPSLPLFISVMSGAIVTSVLAGCSSYFGGLRFDIIVIVWCYCIGTLIIMDITKVMFYKAFNQSQEVIDDNELAKMAGQLEGVRASNPQPEPPKEQRFEDAFSERMTMTGKGVNRTLKHGHSFYGAAVGETIAGRVSLLSTGIKPRVPMNLVNK